MTADPRPPTGLPLRLLAILVAAAPHLVLLGRLWWPRTQFLAWIGTDMAGLPFALYSKAELTIVPTTLSLTLIAALISQTRPLALWLLLGTLSGATLVLLALAQAALTWT